VERGQLWPEDLTAFVLRHGFGQRVAAAFSTALAFIAVVVLFTPLAAAFYLRLRELFAFLQQLPAAVVVSIGGSSARAHPLPSSGDVPAPVSTGRPVAFHSVRLPS